MSRVAGRWASLPIVLVVALAGCSAGDDHAAEKHSDHGEHAAHEGHDDGEHADHDHGGHGDHGEAGDAAARFMSGEGLWLAEPTARALGLETSEVQERALAHSYEVTASVFEAGPPARASSLVPIDVAQDLEEHPPIEGRLLSVRRDLAAALDQVEVVFELPGKYEVGTAVTFTLTAAPQISRAIPRAALLRTASGPCVYVVNGSHLLRTPVRVGATDGAFIEIIDGLYAGDVVATAAVEQLWLTELRLTKGGGHSH